MNIKKKQEGKGFYTKVASDVHTQFKLVCVSKGIKIGEKIEELMLKFIKQNK